MFDIHLLSGPNWSLVPVVPLLLLGFVNVDGLPVVPFTLILIFPGTSIGIGIGDNVLYR